MILAVGIPAYLALILAAAVAAAGGCDQAPPTPSCPPATAAS
jgi:hypothetical protein